MVIPYFQKIILDDIKTNQTMIDLFEAPIKKKIVQNGLYAYRNINGCVNIDGQKYYGFSMTDAIKLYRQKFPKYQKK